MKRILLYTMILIGAVLALAGCSDWLDVNDNPNEALASTITSDLLLSSVQNDMDYDRIADYDIHFLAEHITKSGDFAGSYPFLTGSVDPTSFDYFWSRRYERIANLRNIDEAAVEDGDTGYEGIAKTLMAIEFRELVDMFGDVPFTQAGYGDLYLYPEYDDAATIYDSLIDMLDEAIDLFDQTINNGNYSTGELSDADIYFSGDFEGWKRYAASLELSLLMRISNVSDVSSKIQGVMDKVLDINENVTGNPGYYKGYTTENKMNPLYYLFGFTYLDEEYAGHRAVVPTEEAVKFMRDTDNPLLRVFADARKYLGNDSYGTSHYEYYGLGDEYYIGAPFGQMTPPGANYTSKSGFGVLSKVCNTTEGPCQDIIVMQGSLVGFYLAEAALRGLIDGGDAAAKSYYEQSVTALFNTYETALQSDASTWFSLSNPENARPAITTSAAEAAAGYLCQDNAAVNWDLMSSYDEKMDAIQTQKWLSLFLVDPLEAWSEVRRTDLPSLIHCSHCAAYSNKIMARFMYPDTEKNLNPGNYIEIDNVFTELIFWDTENPDREKPTVYL